MSSLESQRLLDRIANLIYIEKWTAHCSAEVSPREATKGGRRDKVNSSLVNVLRWIPHMRAGHIALLGAVAWIAAISLLHHVINREQGRDGIGFRVGFLPVT
jgi:hypothetical protein